MEGAVTIQDIARLAGVSKSTVSRYLNHGYVSREKSGRIRAIIEETGFKSNFFARRLKTRCSKLVRLSCQDWIPLPWARCFRALQRCWNRMVIRG